MLEKAYAKINLGLDILGRRNDGYHEVNMVMQSLELCDEVIITEAKELMVTTDQENLSGGPSNLAYQAALLLAKKHGVKPNVHIHLIKKIFLAAGLAGGSADCAAVLRGLNKFWQLELSNETLEAYAAELGSDIPFCICGGTSQALGRGELIKPLPDMPETLVVLAKPKVEVSTAWVYKNYAAGDAQQRPRIEALKRGLVLGDLQHIEENMANVLESVTISKYPVLAEIKKLMLACGASTSLMSGSGPTVFGFVETVSTGEQIIQALNDKFDVEAILTKTIKRRG